MLLSLAVQGLSSLPLHSLLPATFPVAFTASAEALALSATGVVLARSTGTTVTLLPRILGHGQSGPLAMELRVGSQ